MSRQISEGRYEEFSETVVRFESTGKHLTLLTVADGRFLREENARLTIGSDADDGAMWRAAGDGFEHAVSGNRLGCTRSMDGYVLLDSDAPAAVSQEPLRVSHGPELLPSAYLEHMREHGWACLTSVLDPELVEGLERVACTDRYAHQKYNRSSPQLCQSGVMAQTAAEPVSLWVVRQYMRTPDIKLGHTPGLAVLAPDDGQRVVQGWHSDYPYHWGVPAEGKVPVGTGQAVLGVQRNVCVSEFSKLGGATVFKLGSHARDEGPPDAWGTVALALRDDYREKHGLPYNGPEADVIEAPGGSIILYDARTWHRAGVNRSDKKRAAMLQAMIPMYILPKNDTSQSYLEFIRSDAFAELNEREKTEFQSLMVQRFIGPGGRFAIGPEKELTDIVS